MLFKHLSDTRPIETFGWDGKGGSQFLCCQGVQVYKKCLFIKITIVCTVFFVRQPKKIQLTIYECSQEPRPSCLSRALILL